MCCTVQILTRQIRRSYLIPVREPRGRSTTRMTGDIRSILACCQIKRHSHSLQRLDREIERI